jgi:hypothetical protein
LIKQQLHKLVHLSLSEHFPSAAASLAKPSAHAFFVHNQTLDDGRRPGPSTAVWRGDLEITGGSSNLTGIQRTTGSGFLLGKKPASQNRHLFPVFSME